MYYFIIGISISPHTLGRLSGFFCNKSLVRLTSSGSTLSGKGGGSLLIIKSKTPLS